MMENIFSNSMAQVIVPQSKKAPRNGEGSAVLLKDEKVFLVYSKFISGGEDHDNAYLLGGNLDIDTGEIKDSRPFFHSESSLNEMCASLERLKNGDIGMVFIRKSVANKDSIFFAKSSDECNRWTEPINISSIVSDQYICVNNDRLRQFSSGRIAIPCAFYPEGKFDQISELGMFYSDDDGKTWSVSNRIKILEKNIRPPHKIFFEIQEEWKRLSTLPIIEQEPGVEELVDGRILLYCRTTIGYMYQAYSSNGGETWSELKAAPEIITPCSPQSIRRIPGQNRLLCIYNDRRDIAFAESEIWDWRTPLSVAVSDDNAKSWQILGNIEDDSHNYCYTNILFLKDKILLTYYESENIKEVRRNLASLKMRILSAPSVSGKKLPA